MSCAPRSEEKFVSIVTTWRGLAAGSLDSICDAGGMTTERAVMLRFTKGTLRFAGRLGGPGFSMSH